MKWRIVIIVLLILLAIPAGIIGLFSTEAGSRWLVRQVLPAVPGAASVKTIEGRLIDRLELTGLQYQSETQSVAIDRLVFDWRAYKLLLGTLDIENVTAQRVRIRLTESQKEEVSAPFQLPDQVPLPIQIILRNVLLTDIELIQDDQTYRVDRLQLSARTEDDRLLLTSLKLEAEPLSAEGRGEITLTRGFPLHLNLDWRNLQWPLNAAQPQLRSEQGTLEVSGRLTGYRIDLSASLTPSELPEAGLTFHGTGDLKSLFIETLELKSPAGFLQLKGDVSWKDKPEFEVTATGRNFDPAIVLPELPGSLTFTAHLKGQMVEETLQLDAELKQLTGKLRGYPLEAGGQLHLSGNRLKIDRFRVVTGSNRLTAEGTLGPEQSDFGIDLNAPRLGQLWPDLGGSLKGQGRMRGGWQNPVVEFQATGRQLLFAQHQAERVAIDIDYHPEANRVSKLNLSASNIRSGDLSIPSIEIQGKGTRKSHRLTAAIRSSYGDLQAALAGTLKDNTWQGSVSRLDSQSRDWGRWRLDKNPDIVISRKASGIDAAVSEGCLARQEASLCVAGSYQAEGDFSTNLKMTQVPLSLVQPFLPEGMAVSGVLNGEADVQRRENRMTGRYRFTLPAGSEISRQTPEQAPQRFVLGASSLSGKIDGDRVSAELDLALPGQDYVRGDLNLNIGKKQTLSGRITASVVELEWLKAFVPQLTDIQGDLKANLTLAGTLAKPEVEGLVRLSGGAVGIAGHRVDAIEIEAVTADPPDRILIEGSAKANGAPVNVTGSYQFDGDYRFALKAPAIPLKLAQPYLPEQIEIDGRLYADAEIRQQKGAMTGNFRLEMPAGTRIIAKTRQPAKPISLGAAVLTGTLDNQIVSADLDMKLAGNDFVRGQLQLDTGRRQAIHGRLTLSVTELKLIDSFVPQLANVKGRLHGDIAVRGTTEKPIVQGSLAMTNASADVVELGLRLRKINFDIATADEQGRRLRIRGFAQSGQGVINMDGFVLLEPGLPVELTLIGEKFEVVKLPEAEVSVSPELKIAFGRGQGSVTGKLKVANADIELKELPAGSVKVSEDEIIMGRKEKQEEAAPINIDVNIEVDLGKNTHFSGFGLETDLIGKLQILQRDRKLFLYGNVDMKEATYKSYGQDLTVRKGRFVFNGPPDNPWLDVEAIRVSKDKKVTAILSLTGPVKNPKTEISSEPALPESEALAYLVTGRSLSQVSKSEGNVLAAAALSYGTGQMTWLADKFGIDEFEVQEGETLQDTLVAVGQYLNPEFYIGAKVGLFNNQAALVLKRKLTESLNVETEAGTSQRIKFNYEFDVDCREKQRSVSSK